MPPDQRRHDSSQNGFEKFDLRHDSITGQKGREGSAGDRAYSINVASGRGVLASAVKSIPDEKDRLRERYEAMESEDDPHKRGYEFQDLLRELFGLLRIEVTRPFTRNDGAEQIDGAFEWGGHQNIVEARWREELANIRELDGLYGQLRVESVTGVRHAVTGREPTTNFKLKYAKLVVDCGQILI